jgi:hypothetical protein
VTSNEFTLRLGARCLRADVLAFVATELDGAEVHEQFLGSPTLSVRGWPLDVQDLAQGRTTFGIWPRTEIRLTPNKRGSYETWHAGFANGVRVSAALLERFGDGVLVWYAEELVLLRLGGRTVLNGLWYGWAETPELADVVARYSRTPGALG